jgi:hypothetical protein
MSFANSPRRQTEQVLAAFYLSGSLRQALQFRVWDESSAPNPNAI